MLVCVHEGCTTVCGYVCMSEVPQCVGVYVYMRGYQCVLVCAWVRFHSVFVCVHEGGTTVCWCVCMSEVPLGVGVCVCMREVSMCVDVCA